MGVKAIKAHMGVDTIISVMNLLVDLELLDRHLPSISLRLEHTILKLHIYFYTLLSYPLPSGLFIYFHIYLVIGGID